MSNSASDRFDQVLGARLRDGETEPPPHVWANIELDLEKKSGEKSRRLVSYYKWMAAACLAALVATVGVFMSRPPVDGDVAKSASVRPGQVQSTDETAAPGNKSEDAQFRATEPPVTAETSQVNRTRAQSPGVGLHPGQLVAMDQEAVESHKSISELGNREQVTNRPLPSLAHLHSIQITFSNMEPDPLSVLLGRLEDERIREEKESKQGKVDQRWTSVAVAAGSFDPNYKAGNNNAVYATNAPGLKSGFSNNGVASAPEAGMSYSFGVNLGARVAPRVALMGGLAYLNQNASFNSSTVKISGANKSEATLADFAEQGDQYPAQAYSIHSNFEFLSVPLQAGYIIVERKFGLQLNGGMATDLFLENTLTPDKSGVNSVSYTASNNPIYRTVNFSGLLGAELSYRLARQYRISIDPGIRLPFNSIYKDGAAAELIPMTLDIGLHFRYIFR